MERRDLEAEREALLNSMRPHVPDELRTKIEKALAVAASTCEYEVTVSQLDASNANDQ